MPATKTARNPEPCAQRGRAEQAARTPACAASRGPRRAAARAHEPQQRAAADEADHGADTHLQQRTHRRRSRRRRALNAAGRDQAGHQRDADRVVGAGLALEDGPAAPGDLALAEHGEHDGRVGRRDRRRDQQREEPAEPEREVQQRGDRRGGEERAEHPRHQRSGRRRRGTGATPMCMPPSKRMKISATVRICSTDVPAARAGRDDLTATAAATSTSSGHRDAAPSPSAGSTARRPARRRATAARSARSGGRRSRGVLRQRRHGQCGADQTSRRALYRGPA